MINTLLFIDENPTGILLKFLNEQDFRHWRKSSAKVSTAKLMLFDRGLKLFCFS